MGGYVFGFVLSVLGLIVLLVRSWWRERNGNSVPAHSHEDVIVTTAGLLAILIGAAVTITKVVIEIAGLLYQ